MLRVLCSEEVDICAGDELITSDTERGHELFGLVGRSLGRAKRIANLVNSSRSATLALISTFVGIGRAKAANLPAAISTSPFGTLFTVPHRHMLVVLPVTGPETLTALEHLAAVTMRVLNSGLPPGGVLSPDIHFSREHEVSRVSSIDEAGVFSIEVDARLHQALEEAAP